MKIDRISINSFLVIAAFLSVLLLSSQSGASLVTYVLALSMLLRFRAWSDVFHCTLIWPILALLAYLPLTALWSSEFTLSELGSQLGRALLILAFVTAFAECQLRGDLQTKLFPAFVLSGAVVAVACIFNFYLTNPADGRLNGFGQLDTQVVVALVFGFAILAGLHALLHEVVAYRLPLLVALVPLVFAVGLSGSRTAWVAVALGISVTFLVRTQWSVSRLIAWVLCLSGLTILAIAASWVTPELHDMIFPRGDSFRLTIWEETLNRIAQKPWFGHGILTADDIESNGLVFYHAHNLYLSVAFQGGFLGVTLFAWLLLRTIRELLRYQEEPDARFALAVLAMALPAYLLDGHELLDKISDTWFLIWLPAAIALGLRWHSVR